MGLGGLRSLKKQLENPKTSTGKQLDDLVLSISIWPRQPYSYALIILKVTIESRFINTKAHASPLHTHQLEVLSTKSINFAYILERFIYGNRRKNITPNSIVAKQQNDNSDEPFCVKMTGNCRNT